MNYVGCSRLMGAISRLICVKFRQRKFSIQLENSSDVYQLTDVHEIVHKKFLAQLGHSTNINQLIAIRSQSTELDEVGHNIFLIRLTNSTD